MKTAIDVLSSVYRVNRSQGLQSDRVTVVFRGNSPYSRGADEFVRLRCHDHEGPCNVNRWETMAGGEMSGLIAHFLFGANSSAKNRRIF